MSKRMVIPDPILDRFYSMYGQGYNFIQISIETGYSKAVVEKRIREEGVKITIKTISIKTKGKYDDLFEEPVCPGKLYSQYKTKF